MAKQERGRLSFLVVARTGPGPHPHPIEVAVHPAGPDTRVSFSVGPHAANVGGQVALSRLLDHPQTGLNPTHEPEFDAADLHWLVPHLVRLRSGEDVVDEIVQGYVDRHGRPPEVMHFERHGE